MQKSEIFKELVLQILLFRGRLRFRWRNRKRLAVTESLKTILRTRCEEAIRAESLAYRGLYNVGLFIALVEQDISAHSESIYFARSEWHRQFHARGLAILLHELNEDMPQLLGKQYREWLKDIGLGQSWFEELNLITSKLSVFRKSHASFLGQVRNYVGAHKDHDAIKQLDTMAAFTGLGVYRLAADFSEPIRDLVAFYVRLLPYMHNPIVMLRQVSKSLPKP
jgi:hypothetical protein